ncbi:MAG: hypothetical protein M0Z66_03640 [Thermaerobacter sp.]|nr:hypothetical protein [Thermaerobacter sp.]
MQRYGMVTMWISDEPLSEVKAREAVRFETRDAIRTALSGALDSAEAWVEKKSLPRPEWD